MENGLSLSRFRAQGFGTLHKDINQATQSVMHTSGEVSSIAFAEHLLDLIEDQSAEDLVIYLEYLLSKYDVDTEVIVKAAKEYSINKNQKNETLFLNHLQKVIDNKTTNADHMISKFSKNEDLSVLYDK